MPRTLAFKKLLAATKRTYLGASVPSKYRSRYGKRYQLKETKAVAIAIAKKKGIKL